jgi:hypothetical protein
MREVEMMPAREMLVTLSGFVIRGQKPALHPAASLIKTIPFQD